MRTQCELRRDDDVALDDDAKIVAGEGVWYVVPRSRLPLRPSTFATGAQSAMVVVTGLTRM